MQIDLDQPAPVLAEPEEVATSKLEITTREELINALQVAVQLEHGLMLQYLFAAISCKKFAPEEGITHQQAERIRKWEGRILKIARDEMAHLATVCNLLNAIGGCPNFNRLNFPQQPNRWNPFGLSLQRLSIATLKRFIRAESPKPTEQLHLLALAPTDITFDFTGELYRSISAGFAAVATGETPLFIGSPLVQDNGDWTSNLNTFAIRDVQSAQAAIAFIVRQGEGQNKDAEGSHYQEFNAILSELETELTADPNFDPARPVIDNPLIRVHPGISEGYTLLTADSEAAKVAELFNSIYGSVLLMLSQFYNPSGETPVQRRLLQDASRRAMSAIIRPLAEMLTQLPVNEGQPATAGAPFEIYSDFLLPSNPQARWIILVERLTAAESEVRTLANTDHPILNRLRFVAKNFSLLLNSIKETSGIA